MHSSEVEEDHQNRLQQQAEDYVFMLINGTLSAEKLKDFAAGHDKPASQALKAIETAIDHAPDAPDGGFQPC